MNERPEEVCKKDRMDGINGDEWGFQWRRSMGYTRRISVKMNESIRCPGLWAGFSDTMSL